MGRVTEDNVADVITYHKATPEEITAISNVRDGVENAIRVFLKNCPECADRSDAIRSLRRAMMMANASIVLKGLI